jgi:transcriptional regulator with XRE-family HTH domain
MGEVIVMSIGERIRATRKARGLTQKQLGELCKPAMADSAVRKYESGTQIPRFDTIQRLAEVLDVPWPYLMGHTSLYADKVEDVIEEYNDFKKYKKALDGLEIILEALYGKRENLQLEGKWMNDTIPIYGKDSESIVLFDEEIETINRAVIGVVEALVASLGKNAEEVISATTEWLDSEEAKAVREEIDAKEVEHEMNNQDPPQLKNRP